MKNTATFAVVCASLLMGGCSSTIHKVSKVDGIDTLSIDAKQRLVLVNEAGGPDRDRRIVCAEPSPDALVAQAAALSGQASTPQSGRAGIAGSLNESAASIGLRTQTIQIFRDGYFRLCEAYMNGSIDSDKYKSVVNHVDSAIAVVLAIDSLGGGVAAPAVAISGGGTTANTTADGTTAGTTAGTNIFENFNIDRTKLSDAQARAIENIIREYLAHKRHVMNSTRRYRKLASR